MQEYFVDTWYLIARLDRFDAHHLRVRRLESQLRLATLVTHDAALTELLAYFSAQGANARLKAAQAVREIAARFIVIPGSRDLFVRALGFYEQRPDKEYSLVDCMSMTLMRERRITHVLTNDHHFRQEGFTIVNE